MEAIAVKEKNNFIQKWDLLLKHWVQEAIDEFNNPENIPSQKIEKGEEISNDMHNLKNDENWKKQLTRISKFGPKKNSS